MITVNCSVMLFKKEILMKQHIPCILFLCLAQTGDIVSAPKPAATDEASSMKLLQAQTLQKKLAECSSYIGLTPGQQRAVAAQSAEAFDKATQARDARWAAGYTTQAPDPDTLTKLDREYWASERDYQHHITCLYQYLESLYPWNDAYSRSELLRVERALEIVRRLTTAP